MTADNHIHTAFSPDGEGDSEDFILHAVNLGLKHIAFTEHVDILYCNPSFVTRDPSEYFDKVRYLKTKYADKISVAVGLEVGFTPSNRELNAEYIEKYRPDYVINSVHEVGGKDLYFKEFFKNKSPREAVSEYLRAVLDSLGAPYEYNTVGHLGYVIRKAPFNCGIYSICPELTDKILKSIIHKGKILEINTSIDKPEQTSVPPRELILRYADLGGKKLCFASDAHRPVDIARNYAAACSVAADAGITCQTVVIDGKETEIPFICR